MQELEGQSLEVYNFLIINIMGEGLLPSSIEEREEWEALSDSDKLKVLENFEYNGLETFYEFFSKDDCKKAFDWFEEAKNYYALKLYFDEFNVATKSKLQTIEGRSNKLNYLRKLQANFLQKGILPPPFLNSEIEYWQGHIEPKPIQENETGKIIDQRVSMKQQVLLLHYLGLLNYKDMALTKKARFFAYILDKTPKNIENSIRYFQNRSVHNPFTEPNLQRVSVIFEEVGLLDLKEKVDNDIIRLRKGKNKLD